MTRPNQSRPALEALESRTLLAIQPLTQLVSDLSGVRPDDSVVDSSGNIYIAGVYDRPTDFDPDPDRAYVLKGMSTDPQHFIAKYSPQGRILWARSIARGIGQFLDPDVINIDSDDNLLIAGTLNGSFDFDPGPATHTLTSAPDTKQPYVWELSPQGNLLAASLMPAADSPEIAINGIDSDSRGNVYIVGSLFPSFLVNPAGCFLIKASPRSGQIWRRHVVGEGASVVAVDAQDRPWFATSTGTVLSGTGSSRLYQFSASGKFRRRVSVGSIIPGPDDGVKDSAYVYSLDFSPTGDVLVAGTHGGSVDFDPRADHQLLLTHPSVSGCAFVSLFSAAGAFKRAFAPFARDLSKSSAGAAFAKDGTTDIVIGGTFRGVVDFDPNPHRNWIFETRLNSHRDLYVARYTQGGRLRFAKHVPTEGDDLARGLSLFGDRAVLADTNGGILLYQDQISLP